MKILFTKYDVWDMQANQKLSAEEVKNKMGFEKLGQGFGYKCEEAFWLGKANDKYENEYICYIPEYCHDRYGIDINSCYTYQDFKELCKNTRYSPMDLFNSVDWQHPKVLLDEWKSYDFSNTNIERK